MYFFVLTSYRTTFSNICSNYLGLDEFEKKRSPPKTETPPDEFDEYIIDDYIDSDHVC